MDMIIESYRDNYWLIAFHLLLLGAFIYGCVTIGKHPWPSLCCVFSVLLAYGTFLWWRLALSVVDGEQMMTVVMHVGQGLSMSSTILLYLAIFGWRAGSPRVHEKHQAMDLPPADHR